MRASFHHVKRIAGLTGAAGILAIAGGCGGGTKSPVAIFGTPSGLTTIPSGTTSQIANTLNVATGDEWFYAVNGFDNVGGGAHTRHIVQGVMNRTLSVSGNQVNADFALTDSTNLQFDDNTQTSTSVVLYLINAGSELDVAADNMGANSNTQTSAMGQLETLDPCSRPNPASFWPTTWNTSTSLSGGDNMFEVESTIVNPPAGTCAFKTLLTNIEVFNTTVLDQENVSVPAGTFQTFKTTQTVAFFTQGQTANITAWWAPQIGGFVKAQYDITNTLTNTSSIYTYQLLGFKNVGVANGS